MRPERSKKKHDKNKQRGWVKTRAEMTWHYMNDYTTHDLVMSAVVKTVLSTGILWKYYNICHMLIAYSCVEICIHNTSYKIRYKKFINQQLDNENVYKAL